MKMYIGIAKGVNGAGHIDILLRLCTAKGYDVTDRYPLLDIPSTSMEAKGERATRSRAGGKGRNHKKRDKDGITIERISAHFPKACGSLVRTKTERRGRTPSVCFRSR